MFDILFENDVDTVGYKTSQTKYFDSGCHPLKMKCPPNPRNESRLCGLENQGSTCYLNSLLQTLLFTPEFREALFSLSEYELGDITAKGSKARIIPLHLQKLFVCLLIVDREAISTTELTNSFGWKTDEELQQHDVQELNRILFSAIESSLIGTSGHNLISQLYRGAISSQVICSQCNTSSQRTEEFLDLTVIVSGKNSLQESLRSAFDDKEILSGKNQYFCNHCSRFVDAEKRDKLISLPPIVTFSLLRFIYDSNQGKRFKDTGSFSFPLEIDMQSFCDKDIGDDSKYQLFSVIVHRGSCYGGHYHAYIEDIDHIGKWSLDEKEAIAVKDEANYLCMTNPVTLIVSLLMKQPPKGLDLNSLCSEIVKIGLSWNKTFKKTFGPITKFLMANSNIFSYNKDTGFVFVKNSPERQSKTNDFERNHKTEEHWFNLNDNHICAAHVGQIEKHFSGEESAYMLFYRRTSLHRPEAAKNNPTFGIPDKLLKLAHDENLAIKEERRRFEEHLQMITLNVHFGKNYHFHAGALHPLFDDLTYMSVTFDRRKTLSELRDHIYQLRPDLCCGANFKLHLTLELPAGMHLYTEFTETNKSLVDNRIVDGMHLFVWDGLKVNGRVFFIGDCWAPILLRISCTTVCGDTFSINHGFPKSSTLKDLKQKLTEITDLNPPIAILRQASFIREAEIENTFVPIDNKDDETLENLGFLDSDHILAKETLPLLEKEKQVFVYDRTKEFATADESLCPKECFTVDKDVALATIKNAAHEKLSIGGDASNYRLRKSLADGGWSIPLYEHLKIEEILTEQILNLFLEEGIPPKENEITVMISIGRLSGDHPDYSINIKKSITLLELRRLVVKHCGLEGDCWHLCKSNWLGDAQEILRKDDPTVKAAGLVHGDLILLQEGRVAPPGFLTFPLWFCDTLENLKNGMEPNWKTSELRKMYRILWQTLQSQASRSAIYLGEIEISSELTLLDLKKYVITLPKLSDIFLPTFRHLRLRLWNNRPGAVLKNNNSILKKLKISNHQPLCAQLVAHEEDLAESDIVLEVKQRVPNTSSYLPSCELVWNAGSSCHVASLRLVLSEATGIPDQNLVMAKHYPVEHNWKTITSSPNTKSKLYKKGKTNLRQSPFCLKDGDVIGVKNRQFDTEDKDDFRTEEEREFWLCLQSNKIPQEKTPINLDVKSPRKPEVGITIHVDDFT